MSLEISIMKIVIGAIKAAISLSGDTWDKKKRCFTNLGWLALSGFVIFALLNVIQEVIVSRSEQKRLLKKNIARYADEISKIFSKHPIDDVQFQVIFDNTSVKNGIKTKGYVDVSIHFFRKNLSVAESEIVRFFILPKNLTSNNHLHLGKLCRRYKRVCSIIKHYDTIKSLDCSNIIFYKTPNETDWNFAPLGNVVLSPQKLIHHMPNTIEELIGQPLRIVERSLDASTSSIIANIMLFHNHRAKLPFLVLSEKVSEPYGTGRWIYNWLPSESFMAEKVISGHPPGFLFDMRSFKQQFMNSLDFK